MCTRTIPSNSSAMKKVGYALLTTHNSQLTTYNFDYFLKDHLGNTRTVLTDEQRVDPYPIASLEDGATNIESQYYNINTGAITTLDVGYKNNNGIGNTNPTANTGAESQKMYRLNGANGDK